MERVEEIRHSEGIKEIYALRSQTIERVFADAKELHGMRYTQYRGLAKVKMELTLKFACMNLKKLALWKARNGFYSLFSKQINAILSNLSKIKESDYQIFIFDSRLSTI